MCGATASEDKAKIFWTDFSIKVLFGRRIVMDQKSWCIELNTTRLDKIGFWSEIKLEILKAYATAYAKILSKQSKKGLNIKFEYIDAFAGAGEHLSKDRNTLIPGSPANALIIQPQFSGYWFI